MTSERWDGVGGEGDQESPLCFHSEVHYLDPQTSRFCLGSLKAPGFCDSVTQSTICAYYHPLWLSARLTSPLSSHPKRNTSIGERLGEIPDLRRWTNATIICSRRWPSYTKLPNSEGVLALRKWIYYKGYVGFKNHAEKFQSFLFICLFAFQILGFLQDSPGSSPVLGW